MAAGTQCTHWTILTATIVFVEMVKRLAAVTPFDEESANMLVEIGMRGFKVASSDITNHPFLEFLAKKKLPILLSSGASNINEIKEEHNELMKKHHEDVEKITSKYTELALSLPEKYVSKEDFKMFSERMNDRFDRLEEKIDNLNNRS